VADLAPSKSRSLAEDFYLNFLVATYGDAFQGGDHAQKGIADDSRYEGLDGDLGVVDCYSSFQF